jgi:hypothetical protein
MLLKKRKKPVKEATSITEKVMLAELLSSEVMIFTFDSRYLIDITSISKINENS